MRSIITSFICLSLASATFSHAENLDDIYRAAIQNNPVLLGAEAQLKSKQELANIQKGALLPNIGGRVSYGYSDATSVSNYSTSGSFGGTSVSADSVNSGKSFDLGHQIIINQSIIDFYTWFSFKGAKTLSEQAQLDFASTQQVIIVNTVKQYLNILRAKENLTSSLAEETAIKQRLEQTKQRYNVGLVAITDVNEAQAAYDLSKVGRLASEGNLEVAYELLGLLTGKSHSEINALSDNYPITSLVNNKDEWVKTALEHNLDLLQAEKAVDAAKYGVKAAKARHYPTLGAAASYSELNRRGEIENQQYGGLLSFKDDNARINSDTLSIGLSLNIPIYTGGATSASVRKAAADQQFAFESLNGTKRSITQQIRALHIASETKMQQVNARQQSIISSQSALDAIQAGYDVGTRNIVDVLTAQRNLYSAQRDYANARFDYVMSLFELKQAAGILSPADIASLNEWTTTLK